MPRPSLALMGRVAPPTHFSQLELLRAPVGLQVTPLFMGLLNSLREGDDGENVTGLVEPPAYATASAKASRSRCTRSIYGTIVADRTCSVWGLR